MSGRTLEQELADRARKLYGEQAPYVVGFVAEVPGYLFDPVFGEEAGATGFGRVRGRMLTSVGEIAVHRVGDLLPIRVTVLRRGDPR